jgi:hypothetical protein
MRSIATVFLQLLLVLALGSTLLLAPEALSAPLDEITNLQTPEVLRQPSHQTELLWQYGGALTAVNAQGNLAFVGIGQRLMVLDISNPGEALLIGQTGQLIGRLSDIEVQGDNVYATIPGFLQGAQIVGGALLVIDISDLTQPQQVAILETPGGAHGLEVDGTYAYVADGEDGITLIDISDPAQPAYADTLLNESVFHLELAGDYLYIAAEDAGLIVLEVVDPLSPVQKFQYIDPISGGEVEEVFLTGSRLYANERGAVHIFSLADPALPDYLDSLRAPDIITYVEFTAGYGNYLYLFDYYEGLQIVDATDPADPGLVDTIPELKEMFFMANPKSRASSFSSPPPKMGC